MTSGEKRFARRLEHFLEDDYLCWYDVPVGGRSEHPDFIVLHPQRGLLILEVKDWRLETIRQIDRQEATILTDRGLKVVPNPLEQARQYAYQVIKPLERDPQLVHPPGSSLQGRLMLPFGHGVVLANITRAQFEQQELGEVLPANRVICRDEMTESQDPENFQKRLWDMFTVQFPHRLSLPQIDRIRGHLFPEIRIRQGSLFDDASDADETESPAEVLPDLMRVMDLQQEQLARSLGTGHRVIHGAAGAGKTLILVYRCLHLARALRKPILVLCYNRTLADRLQAILAEKGAGDQVVVYNFHRWCHAQLRTYNVPPPPNNTDKRAFFDQLVQQVIDGVDQGQIPGGQYGAVMIDEGHDFEPHWFRLATQMVDPDTNSVLVLYDDAQSIYGRSQSRFSFSSVGVEARGRTTILRVNYRNTRQVLDLATRFARELLDPQEAEEDGIPLVPPESAGREGPEPAIIPLPAQPQEIEYIAGHFKRLHEQGRPWSEMAVLHRRVPAAGRIRAVFEREGIPLENLGDRNRQKSATPADTVKMVTMHSSKGLEFPVVALTGLGEMDTAEEREAEEARLLYVAMTRAMDELIVTGPSQSPFLRRIGEAAQA
ncbi:DEAD/DEAH box helicase [Thioalkalivibrio sp. ALgr3]|uniref:DEAD/DEAH box helicase n=1 Tax=Thioalkalivibrio sp. ALgr3 TaxID=1239292 RepID=UPI000367F9A2|nr:3'-5' exonuclease [Thioalkalivibrio sp. ALgr3]